VRKGLTTRRKLLLGMIYVALFLISVGIGAAVPQKKELGQAGPTPINTSAPVGTPPPLLFIDHSRRLFCRARDT
jgi:hypothetical protein